jgi:hypothetical protein
MGAAVKKAAKDLVAKALNTKRNKLGKELLNLVKANEPALKRMDEIKSELKTDASENFKLTIAKLGEVMVSAPKDETFKGTVPTVNPEKFLALSEAKRNQVIKSGLITMEDEYTGAYYGSVRTKLF